MEPVRFGLNNITVLSVFSLIFVQQDYRTIHFFNEESHSAFLNEIMEIASSFSKPFKYIEMKDLKMKRNKSEGLILNVLNLNNMSDTNNIQTVRESVFPDEFTIILFNPINVDIDCYLHTFHFKRWMKLSIKVMILTESLLISNALRNEKWDQISLKPFNATLVLDFIQKHFSTSFPREGVNLKIFFWFNPPNSAVSIIGNNYQFIGPDGILAESLTKRLNATPIFCTDIGINYPNYTNWGSDPIIGPRSHFQFYYTKLMTNNVVTNFTKRLTDKMDLQLTAFPVLEKIMEEKWNYQTEMLYPHEKSCLVVMVPKQTNFDHFIRKIIKNSDIQSICIALLLFTVARIIIQKSSWNQWISVFIKSLGIFLNQAKIRNDNGIEIAWDVNLRGFSALATITLSVIIYKNLITLNYEEIDTIDDLVASNLTIYAPDILEKDDLFWSNLKPVLWGKIHFKTVNDINEDIIMKRKFNNAYVFIDRSAEYVDMLLHIYIPGGRDYERSSRIMKEQLYCLLTSYRIAKKSLFKGYVNEFIRRFVENGIYDKQLEWSRQLNRDVFQVNKYETTSAAHVTLTMDIIFNVFMLYIVGVSVAVIILIFEISLEYARRNYN